MSFPVYDYRSDIRNLFVTPQLRSRFMRLEAGAVAQRHSHDLGHEVFLVLSGRAVFEIEGAEQELGPGQLCVVPACQMHSVRTVGDEPMIMYLSVTPHLQPTHTYWSETGERLPHRFLPSSAYDVQTDTTSPIDELIDRHVAAARAVAVAAEKSASAQQEYGEALKRALAAGDTTAAVQARDALWDAQLALYGQIYAMGAVWNDLAPRAGGDGA